MLIMGWLGLFCHQQAQAQIDFGEYSDYDLTIGTHGDLDFGELVPNEGEKQIKLGDPEMVVIPITGVSYMAVLITISPDDHLVHLQDAENEIPLTINAAYANRGDDNIAHAELVEGNQVVFPLRQRKDGPPQPPPTPPHEGYTPAEETAYLYIYGSLNVGNVSVGEYMGNVNVTVEYY